LLEQPVVIDLFCGLGGWSEGFLAHGYRCLGFDIEAHDYGSGGYPGELTLRDVRSIHGSQFKDATCIVGSSPCQEFSYRAMPWKRAKALPPPYLGMELFQAQFRIQREASEAAGHHIPMVCENVRGAQKWVGRSQWHYGSFYLWGDVPALMPMTTAIKNNGGSWFAIGGPGQTVTGRNPRRSHNRLVSNQCHEGVKNGKDWFGSGENCSLQRKASSRSNSRKAASAQIAKIPFPLASHIAQAMLPLR
jgi:hypothetical protein